MRPRNLLPVLLLAVTIGCTAPPPPPNADPDNTVVNLIDINGQHPETQETVTVRSVYDGDTYTLTDDRKIRILGIDAPEMRADPGDTTTEAQARKCGSHQARDAAAAALLNQPVIITADPEQGNQDRYGRLLRYVTLPNGSDLGAQLLSQGLARVYDEYPVEKTVSYNVIEHQAAQHGTGSWAACGWTE